MRPAILGDTVVHSEKVQMTEAKTHGYDHGARCNCRAAADHNSLLATPQGLIILKTAATVPKGNPTVVQFRKDRPVTLRCNQKRRVPMSAMQIVGHHRIRIAYHAPLRDDPLG